MKSKLAHRNKQFTQEKELQKLATMREQIMQWVEKECHDEDIPLEERAELLCALVEQVMQIIEVEQRLLKF